MNYLEDDRLRRICGKREILPSQTVMEVVVKGHYCLIDLFGNFE